MEIAWRWIFGIPFLAVCWMEARKILAALPFASTGVSSIDAQNPWVAAVQISNAWPIYQPHLFTVLGWLLPLASLGWIVVSGLGRGLLLKRIQPGLPFRPAGMMVLQAAWLGLMWVTVWGWLRSMAWAASTHITASASEEPDLVGYAFWAIFLSLGFFTAWALVSWPLSIAPILMLFERCGPMQAMARSLKLGKQFSSKLVEANLVMGIVALALIVLAMVFSAAPLPFSDQLGTEALHAVWACAFVFFLVASDYFQVVRLKGFVEFWKMFRGHPSDSAL
jgi:hypothetical protein